MINFSDEQVRDVQNDPNKILSLLETSEILRRELNRREHDMKIERDRLRALISELQYRVADLEYARHPYWAGLY